MKKAFKRTFLITLILIVVYFGSILLFFTKSHGMNFFSGESGENGNSTSILMLGVDSLNSNDGGNSRSDTMMLLNYNKGSNTFSIVSIPRDTRTVIPGRANKERINHAYAYGGAELSLQVVNNLLGTNIKNYLVVDYGLVEKIVDVMGGVKVEVPQDMHYEDPTANPPLYIDLKQGEQVLNGDESLQLLRFRGYPTADLGRVQVQQAFMSSFLGKVKSPLTVAKLPLLVKAYGENSNSNVSLNTLFNLFMGSLKVSDDGIQGYTLPGEPQMIGGVSYFINYDQQSRELIDQIMN
ncbi:MAG: LCP family protein [Tissierellia bacterium]|nr:LCP family protein [Tissierellia bacterium]